MAKKQDLPRVAVNGEFAGMTLQQIEAMYPGAHKSTGKKRPYSPDIFSKYLIIEGPAHWLFRIGFASIFMVNAVYAVFEPESFATVLEQNVVTSAIGMTDLMVKFAIFNDIILSVFILGGWRKQFVYAWAGAWLLLPSGIKLMNLIVQV